MFVDRFKSRKSMYLFLGPHSVGTIEDLWKNKWMLKLL